MGQSIARRIARGYAGLLAILFLMVLVTILAAAVVHRSSEDVGGVSLPRIERTRELSQAIERMRVGTIRLLDPQGSATGRAMVAENAARVAALLEALAPLERGPGEHRAFEEMRAHFARFRAETARIDAAVRAGRPAEARALLPAAQRTGEQLRTATVRYADLYFDRIAAAGVVATGALRWAVLLAIALAVASLLIALSNWRRETREVVAPLLELRVAMDALARGGAAPASHPAAANTLEIAALQEGYNRMAAQIRADALALEAARDQLEARVAEQTAELRANAEDLARMVEELRAMDKLKSDFMAVVSHELLTPINFIIGFGSALEDELLGPLNERQADAMRKLMGGADRLTRMVRNTLEYTKALAGELAVVPTEVDLGRLVEAVTDEAGAALDAKGQPLTVELPADLPAVRADADRVAEVLAELLRNASEFSPPGKPIAVRVTASAADVTVEVADQGPGLPEEAIGRLFEPFYQADSTSTREHGGMGLGLALARHLVGAMGGTIVAASRPGEGARFWFTLPTAARPASPGAVLQDGEGQGAGR